MRHMATTGRPPLIICFGDSLTAGFQSPTSERPVPADTPYGGFLQQRLGGLARVAVHGICGERTDEMRTRFGRDVLAHMPAWVVILGGTNDLGWNGAPERILRNLIAMYEAALERDIRPVAVTVPSIRAEDGPAGALPAPAAPMAIEAKQWVDGHIARRRAVNDLLKDHCGKRGIPCLDLFAETAEPESLMLDARYSNDGLHLTTAGYERFGALLYERVFAPALVTDARAGADRP